MPRPQREGTTLHYTYEDESGIGLYIINRIDNPSDGSKAVWITQPNGNKGYGGRKVLYGLPDVACATKVLLVEGEKKCEAAVRKNIVPDFTVTTAPGGASGYRTVDLKPLVKPGLSIILWRDNDEPGEQWEKGFYRRLSDAYEKVGLDLDLTFIQPPKDKPMGWDCHDAIKDGTDIPALIATRLDVKQWKLASGYGDDSPSVLIADRILGQLSLMFTAGRLWLWQDNIWRTMEDAALHRVIVSHLGMKATAKKLDEITKLLKAISYAESPFSTPDGEMRIFAKGGDVRIRGGGQEWWSEYADPEPTTFTRSRIPVVYRDDDEWEKAFSVVRENRAKADAYVANQPLDFLGLLRRMWNGEPDVEDRIRFLRQWMGYSLVASVRIPCLLFFWGPGATGKSTIADIINRFLGRENVAHVLTKNLDGQFDLASLEGKLANIVHELPKGQRLPDAMLKLMSDANEMTINRKGVQQYTARITAKHLYVTNHVPWCSDTSDSMFRRLRILTFKNVVPADLQDRALTDKIVGSELEMSAILRWAIDGLIDLLNLGFFVEPPSSVRAKAQWRGEWDVVGEFIKTECTVHENAKIGRQKLYDRFKDWCFSNGHQPLNSRHFRDRVEENCPTVRDDPSHANGRNYLGIGLRAPYGVPEFDFRKELMMVAEARGEATTT